MGKEHEFKVEGKTYYYYEDSGNLYRVDPDPLFGPFGLTRSTLIGNAKDIETAIAMAKNDAKERR
jgi:hypothetical protein